jgi:hypothetical protein
MRNREKFAIAERRTFGQKNKEIINAPDLLSRRLDPFGHHFFGTATASAAPSGAERDGSWHLPMGRAAAPAPADLATSN